MRKIIRSCIIVVLCAMSVLAFTACFTTSKTTNVAISWDEGLTTGVTRITNDGILKSNVKASPDGNKLLYTESTKKDVNGNQVWSIAYLRDANNPAKTPLIADNSFDPSWYLDNSLFLYVSFEGGKGRVVRSNVTGGGRTYVSRNPVGDTDRRPAIKNDLIVCQSFLNGRWQLVTVKENGTEPTFLGEGYQPAWHPKEDKVIFIKNGDIYEMDMSQGNMGQVTQLYVNNQFACYTPSYSPDGSHILFAMGTIVKKDIVVAQETTSTGFISKLLPSFVKIPKITKDTTRLVGEVERTSIFVINSDGSNLSTSLNSGTANVFSPCWGKNNEVFCIVDNGKETDIYKFRLRF